MQEPQEPRWALVEALLDASDAVEVLTFDLDPTAAHGRRVLRDRVAADLAGHAARLADLDAPLLVVLGGVTGAGKSTFLNTLVGREVATTGPLRPTTQVPTLVLHPSDRDAFVSERVLPRLARLEGTAGALPPEEGRNVLRLVPTGTVPPGLAVLDAPDVDSVATVNRELADQLLDAADLWVWFTTAGKYADAESMRYLRRARRRATALAVALSLVHHGDIDEVVADFRRKLAAEGLADATLFTIPVSAVFGQRFPPSVGGDLRDWLHRLAAPQARRSHRLQTLRGALAAVPADLDALADAVSDELRVARDLLHGADRAYDSAAAEFARTLDEGLPLRNEVVDRWDRFVGAGKALKLTESAAGQARTWVRNLLAGVGQPEERRLERQVRVEVADTVAGTAAKLADLAAAQICGAWAATPAGRGLVPALAPRRGDDFDERAGAAVRAWQAYVAEQVSSVGASRRSQARVLSSVVSVTATGAILVALAQAGLTGAEAGIAAAAGAANHGLLIKLLGEANLRALVREARRDLLARFDELVAVERRRFTAAVADLAPDPQALDRLAQVRERLLAARDALPPADA